jgi:hypothetical protein
VVGIGLQSCPWAPTVSYAHAVVGAVIGYIAGADAVKEQSLQLQNLIDNEGAEAGGNRIFRERSDARKTSHLAGFRV